MHSGTKRCSKTPTPLSKPHRTIKIAVGVLLVDVWVLFRKFEMRIKKYGFRRTLQKLLLPVRVENGVWMKVFKQQ